MTSLIAELAKLSGSQRRNLKLKILSSLKLSNYLPFLFKETQMVGVDDYNDGHVDDGNHLLRLWLSSEDFARA